MSENFNETCVIRADQEATDASAIFFATVKSQANNNAFLDVARVWKGEVPKETWTWASQLQSEEEDLNNGIVGDSYLIYGNPNGSVNGFFAFPCITKQTTFEEATALLGIGSEPRDFVATFDEPFPIIDGSPLGITTNGYVVAAFCFVFMVGIFAGVLGSKLLRQKT